MADDNIDRSVTESIVREAPEIEALKLGLINSAKNLSDQRIVLPKQQIAGRTGLQERSVNLLNQPQGIGGYQRYLQSGAGSIDKGLSALGTGANTMAQGLHTLTSRALPTLSTAQSRLGDAATTLQKGLGRQQAGYDVLGTALGTLGQAQAPITAAQQAIAGTGQRFAPTDLSAYQNPYQQQVIDTTLAEMNRQAEISRNNLAAQGVGAGAFGGSRFGIAGAELDRNLADSQARAVAQLNSQNYSQALGASQSAFEDQQRRQQQQSQLYGNVAGLYGSMSGQQAGIGGQQAGIGVQEAGIGGQQSNLGGQYASLGAQQAGVGLQQAGIGGQQAGIGGQYAGIGGQQLGLGQLAQTMGMKDIALTSQLGQEQQQQQQRELDATRANEQRQQYEPYSRIAFLSDMYKSAPSTQTSLGSQIAPAAPTPSAFQQIAGVGTGLLGTAAAAKQLGGLF
jgi:hypothetical protein